VKFSSVISIQIFSLKNANPSFNKIHVENDYFPLPSKFKYEVSACVHKVYIESQCPIAPEREQPVVAFIVMEAKLKNGPVSLA
jgi:hypothetical protein